MIELVKEVMTQTVEEWNKKFIESKEKFNLVEEISMIHTKILLYCALGENITDVELPYYNKGKKEKLKLSFFAREVFGK